MKWITTSNISWITLSIFSGRSKKKYGTGRERKTELRSFDTIEAAAVAANNEKLYVNRVEGFAGTSLKKMSLFAIVAIWTISLFFGTTVLL